MAALQSTFPSMSLIKLNGNKRDIFSRADIAKCSIGMQSDCHEKYWKSVKKNKSWGSLKPFSLHGFYRKTPEGRQTKADRQQQALAFLWVSWCTLSAKSSASTPRIDVWGVKSGSWCQCASWERESIPAVPLCFLACCFNYSRFSVWFSLTALIQLLSSSSSSW